VTATKRPVERERRRDRERRARENATPQEPRELTGFERFVNRRSSEYILPDGRFLREIGEGMMPRPHAGAESDMSPHQSSRTRFCSPRRGIAPGRFNATAS
jgi:hypothetical protein